MDEPKVVSRERSPELSSMAARLLSGDLGLLPVFVGLVIIWAIFQVADPVFLTPRNLSNLILQIAVIGMLGIGETLVLLLGEIDLSVAALSGVAGAMLVILSISLHFDAWVTILGVLLVTTLLGWVQGLWISLIGVPAFIVTLAGWLAFQGLTLALIGQQGTVIILSNTLLAIATIYLPRAVGWLLGALLVALLVWLDLRTRRLRARYGLSLPSSRQSLARIVAIAVITALVVATLNAYKGIPLVGLLLMIAVGAFAFITGSTPFGRKIYALGGNQEAARRAGLNVAWIRVWVFTISGFMAGIGGIIYASRLGAASPAAGSGNLLLDSIATAVIGGTSLFGGRGSVFNALAGALVIGSVENGMDLLSVPSSTRYLVQGGILLLAVTVDTLSRQRRRSAGRA